MRYVGQKWIQVQSVNDHFWHCILASQFQTHHMTSLLNVVMCYLSVISAAVSVNVCEAAESPKEQAGK